MVQWQRKVVQILVHNHLPTGHNPDPNHNQNPTTKQHAVVSIQLNVVTCGTFPDKFIRDAPFLLLSVVILYLSRTLLTALFHIMLTVKTFLKI